MWEVIVFKGDEVMQIGIESCGNFEEFAEMSVEFWKEHGADAVIIKKTKGEKKK